MAKFKKPIDTSKTEGQNVAPEGDYVLVATKTEIKESQNNSNNEFISVIFKIAKGQYKGMQVYNNYNYWNENENAENIGRIQWKNLVLAIFGKDKKMSDTDEILNRPFSATLGIKDDDYGRKNVIKKYLTNDEEEPDKEKKGKKNKDKNQVPDDWAEETNKKKDKKKDKEKKGKKNK